MLSQLCFGSQLPDISFFIILYLTCVFCFKISFVSTLLTLVLFFNPACLFFNLVSPIYIQCNFYYIKIYTCYLIPVEYGHMNAISGVPARFLTSNSSTTRTGPLKLIPISTSKGKKIPFIALSLEFGASGICFCRSNFLG